jgi:hypothetical protein
MKKITVLFLALLSFTNICEASELMKEVCLHARGCEQFLAKESDPQSMLKEYAEFVDEAPLEKHKFIEFPVALPRIGETNWGILSQEMAIEFIRSHQKISFRAGPKKESLDKVIELLLKTSHLKFGFTASTGGSLCGVDFPGLLIFDTEKKVLFDLSLFGWPSC